MDGTQIAAALYEASRTKTPIPCFVEQGIEINEDQSYEIQRKILEQKVQAGAEIRGYKIGLTTYETQKIYQTDHPFYGTFVDGDVVEGHVSFSDFFSAFVLEMEIAFFVEEDFSENADVEEIAKKTKIAAAMEMPDGRYINWTKNQNLNWIRADMGVAGKVAVGTPRTYKLEELKELEATLYLNGEKIAYGTGENLLGDPMKPLLWLVKTLEKQKTPLKKGMIVSGGSVTMPLPMQKGVYRVELTRTEPLELEVC